MPEARILTSYYRPKPGGFCKRYFRAIRALLKQGAVVHYLAVERFPIDDDNCVFHRFPWPKNKTENILFWFCFHLAAPFMLLFIGVQQKITHAFAFSPTYALFMQPLRIVKNIPLAVFVRGDAVAGHRIKGKPAWIVMLDQLLEGFAIHGVGLYGVSDSLTAGVIGRHKFFKPAVYSTLRNDIELTGFLPVKADKDPFVIACVGILEKTKNQQLLLNCLKFIAQPAIVLYLYGTGPDKESLKLIADEFDIRERVEFKGWVDSESIWPNVHLLTAPSLYEGAPNAVLEAIAHGIPVLASDIPAHSEILPSSSLLSLDDEGGWIDRLVELFENRNLLEALRKDQQEFSRQLIFDWEQKISGLILAR